MAQGAGANDDIDHAALIGGLTTVDDAGVGNETDRTASRELMSAMKFSACLQLVCLCGGDDAGVGKKADRTASTELMAVMRLKVPVVAMRSSA